MPDANGNPTLAEVEMVNPSLKGLLQPGDEKFFTSPSTTALGSPPPASPPVPPAPSVAGAIPVPQPADWNNPAGPSPWTPSTERKDVPNWGMGPMQASRFALTRRPNPYANPPSFASVATDPSTGQLSIANPTLTKLGKVLALFGSAAQGAAAGTGQLTLGQGAMAAEQARNQNIAQYQEQQQRALNLQQARMRMPWEIAQEQQKYQLGQQALTTGEYEQQIKAAQARGETLQYTQNPDGSYQAQRYDRLGNPIGQPIKNVGTGAAVAAFMKPHLEPRPVFNPNDSTDPMPHAANFNKITGKYEDLDGNVIPNARPWQATAAKPMLPALPGSQQAAVAEQVGPRPTTNVYKGTTYGSVAEAVAAHGRDTQAFITKAKRDAAMGALQPGDIQSIGEGIKSGNIAPDLKGLGRGGVGAAVQAYLARQGYNLANAQRDWVSTLNYYRNLNNSQQVRLGQNVRNADGMLDRIEQLYQQWQATGLPTGFKAFNRAALQASKQLPGNAGAAATMLDQQIAEFTADMGNVLMGGNSPTDHALTLAGKIMSGDWNAQTFEEAVRNAHWNIKNRRNAIEGGTPEGVTPGSPYSPTPNNPPPQKGNRPPGW